MGRDVYFLRDAEHVKVGVATNFRARLGQLQTGNSRPLELVGLWAVEDDGIDAREFESLMHRLLKPYHIRGEWFKIGSRELDTVHRYAWSLFQSTAARKDVQDRSSGHPHSGKGSLRRKSSDQKSQQPDRVSGQATASRNQALPVDTLPKPKRGRPKTITDMAAYKAAKQRQYRARKKASAEGRE